MAELPPPNVDSLVLEYLSAKGFADAEDALRRQLARKADTGPGTSREGEAGISKLETVLLRSSLGASASLLEAAAVGPAGLAAVPTKSPEKGSPRKPVAVHWHDPQGDPNADEWTDDDVRSPTAAALPPRASRTVP